MSTDEAQPELREISVNLIDRNPDNPRLLFRSSEMDQLLESIRMYGVRVPIAVYREGRRFVLIDGERRWRCCLKLNMKSIPALVQEKPEPLTNLLLMFNIHALREQWDYLTIALKLPRIIDLLERESGAAPNERQLSAQTGLTLGQIRRCKLLIDLPERYKERILEELKKPKPRQALTEDFFIEMEKALKTVERAMPGVIKNKDDVREALIEKYEKKVIGNIVHFRKLSKIARAELVSADQGRARQALNRLFLRNSYSIENAFGDSVSSAYTERDLASRIKGLIEKLEETPSSELDEVVRGQLRVLASLIGRLLKSR